MTYGDERKPGGRDIHLPQGNTLVGTLSSTRFTFLYYLLGEQLRMKCYLLA